MLKYEYFADIRGFRCNKQQAAGLCVWAYQISAGGPFMAITRRRLHSSNYAVSEQVVTSREPRGEPLNSAPADRHSIVSGAILRVSL